MTCRPTRLAEVVCTGSRQFFLRLGKLRVLYAPATFEISYHADARLLATLRDFELLRALNSLPLVATGRPRRHYRGFSAAAGNARSGEPS